MIRRLFWLVLGAVLGVSGYRRVNALARSLAPGAGPARRAALPGRPGPAEPRSDQPFAPDHGRGSPARLAPTRSPSVLARAREVVRFAADVRDGMEIYSARHPRRAPNTLERQQARTARPAAGAQRPGRSEQAEDGR